MLNDNVGHVSALIEQQFPLHFRQHGPALIAFVHAYFEWMEQEGNVLDAARRISDSVDIDLTADRFLENFRNHYMVGLPAEIVGNQRFLQKHILDLYRSKGSKASIELLFRLLYNEHATVYVPSVDIFTTSDNVWSQMLYIEVEGEADPLTYYGKVITGLASGATAQVANFEKKMVDTKTIKMLYVENVRGTFLEHEALLCDGVDISNPYTVHGSVTGAQVIDSFPDWSVGDVLYPTFQDERYGQGLEMIASAVDNRSTGVINPLVRDGADGYSELSIVTITAGSNVSGVGAEFRIGSLSNQRPFSGTYEIIQTYANVAFNSNNYGMPGNVAATSSSWINDALDYVTVNIGTIESLIAINPGFGYDGTVNISVEEPLTSTLGFITPSGRLWGVGAIIDGPAVFGANFLTSVKIANSGVGYDLTGSRMTVTNAANTRYATVEVQTGAIGHENGRFLNTRSFTSEDKYITDSYFYQEFSYEIQSSRSLEHYADIVKHIVHPAGNLLFGAVKQTGIATHPSTLTTTVIQT